MSWVTPVGFSWSASRGGVFRDCARAYYFQYYLANRRALDATPSDAAEAARLKQLTTIPLWVGSRVHDAIHGLLQTASAGKPNDVEAAIDSMIETMRRDYRDSVDDRARQSGDPRGVTRFHEHEYARQVPREEWATRTEEAKAMVRAFAARGYLDRVRGLGAGAIRALEDLQDWPLDGVRIFVKIDLAFQDERGVVSILDWKTGQRERGENPLQMMSYALFATRRWGLTTEQLEVMEVYLRLKDPERRCRLTPEALDDAQAQIRASIEAMLGCLDDPRQDCARRERLPATPSPWKCRWCNFLALCPEGQEAL